MSFNKLIPPQTLVVPLGSSFSLYSINTNSLSPTTVTTEDISATPVAQGAKHGPKVVLNKQKILTNIYNKEKLDAMCLCETHQTWYSPLTAHILSPTNLKSTNMALQSSPDWMLWMWSEKTTSLPRKSPGKTKTCG